MTKWTKNLTLAGTPMNEYCSITSTAGPVIVMVWTGESYLDATGGNEVCTAYIPVNTPSYSDGLTLISRRILGKVTRATAKKNAVVLAKTALAGLGLLPKAPTPMRDPNYGAPWA